MNSNNSLSLGDFSMEWLLLFVALSVLIIYAVWATRKARSRMEHLRQEAEGAAQTLQDWHATSTEETLVALHTGREGIDSEEAEKRLLHYGQNRLPEAKQRSAMIRFLYQFHNVLIYVLLMAAVVTTLLEHWLDAAVIFGVVLINAIIGFVQEGKAEDALAAIRQMLSPKAMVIRGGHRITVDAQNLVPGDLVPLQAGDKVSADMRLVQAKGLRIEEAALTGESVPVEKGTMAVEVDAVLADRRSMAYSGTMVTGGQGMGVVTATAEYTELGRISALVAGVEQLTTPLLRQMDQFGRWLTVAIILLALFTFGFGVLVRDYSAAQMFLAAVGLAVAAIPEGLPAIMTITLAIGVQRMAAKNAIIRRLPAVETLGTLSVICSDKTGTLTKNQMTVRVIALPGRELEVTGTGYDPHGSFVLHDVDYDVEPDQVLQQALRTVLLCNDSSAELDGGAWQIQGDPMESALTVAGIKAGLEPKLEQERYPRTDIIPFDSAHKFMATLHHSHEGEAFVCMKGAPEKVFERCSRQLGANGPEDFILDDWERRMHALASKGYRVLAVAMKPVEPHQAELDFADVDEGLTLLGLMGLIDPPRPEAIEAVGICQGAGIGVKMITGDHQVTASAIAHQVGLSNADASLTGSQLADLSDEDLQAQVEAVNVYARVTPEHKLRLVRLLQEQGHVVAMTGDGVNDAPALKRADVGVAMGENGTEVAKEASETVLADDNFSSIVQAVMEGRTVYDNLKKAILFILPTNGGEALVMLGAVVMGFQSFPLTPVQILWVNMITAVTLALALAFEPSEPGLLKRKPRNPREPVLTPLFIWRIGFVSLILMVGTFGLYLWELEQGGSVELARTVAVNTLVMFEIFYLFNSRYILEPVLNRNGLLGNRYALIAVGLLILFQLAFTYLSPLQKLFGTADIGFEMWLRIVLVASSVLWLVEIEKIMVRRIRGRSVAA